MRKHDFVKGKKMLEVTVSGGGVGVCGVKSPYKRKWKQMIMHKIEPLSPGICTENCCVKLQFYITEARTKRNDLDNLIKPVFSALEGTIIEDDRQIFSVDATKFPVNSLKGERLHIELWEWKR